MDINRKIVKRSWDQKNTGLKASVGSSISLGNFRLVNNLGPVNKMDKKTTGNQKFVSDSSDYIRFKVQNAAHKTWKEGKY
tara:strand:- start:1005 stop:1244 length:240 start_codon:yes stop_codon:yes gene_type:complete